jgi:Kef-type K+ transport system membrane component KefB
MVRQDIGQMAGGGPEGPTPRRRRRTFLWLALVLPAAAMAEAGAHVDPVAAVALELAVLLVAARLGAEIATRFGQAPVLGELLAGVLIGNLDLFGLTLLEPIAADPGVDLLSRLGVIFLLFEIGLEATFAQMLSVGGSSLLVAVLGVMAPFGLGWATAAAVIPGASPYVCAFVGATLSATSVGITARVLRDLGASRTPEARIILGAAVIDDVLGLLVLSGVTAVIAAAAAGTGVDLGAVAGTLGKAMLFLVGSVVLGVALTPRMLHGALRLSTPGVLLAVGLAFCLLLSWAASAMGLAPIVGAFAAGLMLEEVHYRGFKERGEHGLEELVRPISGFLAPVFFAVMGMRTDLRVFADPAVLGLAAALVVAAVIGKQACGLGVLGGKADRITVGIGMIPRGEVGLIFAEIGRGLSVGGVPVVAPPTFAAVIVMVVVTTLLTPTALAWRIRKLGAGSGASQGARP